MLFPTYLRLGLRLASSREDLHQLLRVAAGHDLPQTTLHYILHRVLSSDSAGNMDK